MPKPIVEGESPEKRAYLAAQKRRNYAIGLGLLGFVVLVFLVSIIRMTEGMRH